MGGDVNFPFLLAKMVDATQHAGWGGMSTFPELAKMVDATHHVGWGGGGWGMLMFVQLSAEGQCQEVRRVDMFGMLLHPRQCMTLFGETRKSAVLLLAQARTQSFHMLLLRVADIHILILLILLRVTGVRSPPLLHLWSQCWISDLLDLHEVLCLQLHGDILAGHVADAMYTMYDRVSLRRGWPILKSDWFRFASGGVICC